MRKVLPIIFACCVGIGVADATVRDASTISRSATQTVSGVRSTAGKNIVSREPSTTNNRTRTTTPTTTSRTTTARNASSGTLRTATARNAATLHRATGTATQSRAAGATISRATNNTITTGSKTFGTGYNTCRDAYFTCMDQFCATQDETYRRCVCSSRLYEIKKKQNALSQSSEQLQDFKDLNIEAIPKTAAEVQAMQTASEGEIVSSVLKDKSASIAQLAGISAVLANTKSKSLSTAGQLDIAGDINAIWATTDLTSGLNISNLTGEILYSAVHSQCVNLVADRCESKSLLNMVVSAYSMYIENDCALLATAMDKGKTAANASIRETEREMNTARLKNYDAHNSSSINECIAKVRQDITTDNACGTDYVHCLDVTGLYLNKTTGEPIYTSSFYQLGSMLSLSGDILTNQTNRALILELNRKRMFAEKSLDTCRDLADAVWDEFMRQAITEIYQGQQKRIRNVKDECLDVVNKCYDAQSNSLKDFSNTNEQLLLGSQLELSEELCREKLDACSNLYGGGPAGMDELVTTMGNITTQKIAQNCLATLQDYAAKLCAVPPSDSLHSYPYACRAYAPGDQQYASMWKCNMESVAVSGLKTPTTQVTQTATTPASTPASAPASTTSSNTATTISSSTMEPDIEDSPQSELPTNETENSCLIKYTSCKSGYYMQNLDGTIVFPPYTEATSGNRCIACPPKGCPQKVTPTDDDDSGEDPSGDDPGETGEDDAIVYVPVCGTDYAGSLYQKLVRYAVQACMRPSETLKLEKESTLPDTLLQDVNTAMDSIKVDMAKSLKTECERLGGYWVSAQWTDSVTKKTGIELLSDFYNETGANTKWGYCAKPDTISAYYENKKETSTSNNSQTDAPQQTTP